MESHAQTVEYDIKTQTVTVCYDGGSVWQYAPVSQESWSKFDDSRMDRGKVLKALLRSPGVVGVKKARN